MDREKNDFYWIASRLEYSEWFEENTPTGILLNGHEVRYLQPDHDTYFPV